VISIARLQYQRVNHGQAVRLVLGMIRFAANVSGFANVVANLWWECRAKEASFARLTRTGAMVANPRWQDGYSMEL